MPNIPRQYEQFHPLPDELTPTPHLFQQEAKHWRESQNVYSDGYEGDGQRFTHSRLGSDAQQHSRFNIPTNHIHATDRTKEAQLFSQRNSLLNRVKPTTFPQNTIHTADATLQTVKLMTTDQQISQIQSQRYGTNQSNFIKITKYCLGCFNLIMEIFSF